jgi:tetratricopeptide (TPR) repeat protein
MTTDCPIAFAGSAAHFGKRASFRARLGTWLLAVSATVVTVFALPLRSVGAESLTQANADLQAGKADAAVSLLRDALKADPNDAEANNLICRVEFTLQQFDQASGHCEKAVSLNSQNARYHLWLGRTYGERASRASFLSAFSLAKKTRDEFETSVRLDPKDADALTDLGQFYEEAPGAIGGGMDKAEGTARQLEAIDAARGHDFLGEIAEHKKDLAGAEREFKTALNGAAHPAFQWMALASFYRRQQRWDDMEAAVKSGYAAAGRDKKAAVALFNGASTLARANRQPELAAKMFADYVASPEKTEEAAAFEALTRLAKLHKKMGDMAAAKSDQAAALALAHDYKPALNALQDGK